MAPSIPEPPAAPVLRRSRWVVYLLIAVAAFLAGMAFEQWGLQSDGARSRVDWPGTTGKP